MGHFGVSYLEVLILIGCSVRRSLVQMYVRTASFLLHQFLCQKESKLGKVVASSVAWFERWVSSLVVWVGSYLVGISAHKGTVTKLEER